MTFSNFLAVAYHFTHFCLFVAGAWAVKCIEVESPSQKTDVKTTVKPV